MKEIEKIIECQLLTKEQIKIITKYLKKLERKCLKIDPVTLFDEYENDNFHFPYLENNSFHSIYHLNLNQDILKLEKYIFKQEILKRLKERDEYKRKSNALLNLFKTK